MSERERAVKRLTKSMESAARDIAGWSRKDGDVLLTAYGLVDAALAALPNQQAVIAALNGEGAVADYQRGYGDAGYDNGTLMTWLVALRAALERIIGSTHSWSLSDAVEAGARVLTDTAAAAQAERERIEAPWRDMLRAVERRVMPDGSSCYCNEPHGPASTDVPSRPPTPHRRAGGDVSLVKIPEKELDALRKKAVAHDAYLAACKKMAERQYTILAVPTVVGRDGVLDTRSFRAGWLACLAEFDQHVVDAAGEAPMLTE